MSCALGKSLTEGSGPGLASWFGVHLLDDIGDADDCFTKRRQRGLVSRIDVNAGGAGLDSMIPITQRVALVPVETVAGRAGLDPRQSVPGRGRTRQLSFGKGWKNRKLH